MPRTDAVDLDNAPQGSRSYMEQGAKQAGSLINFFRQVGAAPAAIKGYMDFAATLEGGALDRQTQEAIAVAVSDFDGCKY